MNEDHYTSWLQSMTDAELCREYALRMSRPRGNEELIEKCEQERARRGRLRIWERSVRPGELQR